MLNKAIAVSYNDSLPAPFIVAKGKKRLAERIIQIARKHGVEIVKSSDLTDVLFEIEVGSFIPEDLYEIIAELLAYVYNVQAEL
jgi:flagellar biosynthesis protein